MYDKWSVLRVETVINNPRDFRVVRFARDRKGRLHLQIGEAVNRRYLDALAVAMPKFILVVPPRPRMAARRDLGQCHR